MEPLTLDTIEEALREFQGDPFVFFEETWGLTPQPIKKRYVPMLEHLLNTPAKYFNLEVTLFHPEMFGEFRGDKAARIGQFKWLESAKGNGLFDLSNDPGEEHDLSATQPEVAARIRERYAAWRKEMDAAEPRGPFRDY